MCGIRHVLPHMISTSPLPEQAIMIFCPPLSVDAHEVATESGTVIYRPPIADWPTANWSKQQRNIPLPGHVTLKHPGIFALRARPRCTMRSPTLSTRARPTLRGRCYSSCWVGMGIARILLASELVHSWLAHGLLIRLGE